MNSASVMTIAFLAVAAASAKAGETTPDVEAMLHQLSDLDHGLSIESLDRAHEIEARLDLMDQLETKLLEIAKKRLDRRVLETGERAPTRQGETQDRPLGELEGDPRVVDIAGHGTDLTARLIGVDRSTFAVKVGARLGAYRVDSISAANGVEVVDPKGRRHNLPEVEESETGYIVNSTAPSAPPGIVPVLPKR